MKVKIDNILVIQELFSDRLDDVSTFLSEMNQSFSALKWQQTLEWMYKDNPYIKNESLGWGITEINTGKIFGFLGKIPVMYSNGMYLVNGYWLTSWCVKEEARSLSLNLFNKVANSNDLLLSNTPTPFSIKIHNRFNFKRSNQVWGSKVLIYLLPYKILQGSYNILPKNKYAVLLLITRILITPFFLLLDFLTMFRYNIHVITHFEYAEIKRIYYQNNSDTNLFFINDLDKLYGWLLCNKNFKDDFMCVGFYKKSHLIEASIVKKTYFRNFRAWTCIDYINNNKRISFFQRIVFLRHFVRISNLNELLIWRSKSRDYCSWNFMLSFLKINAFYRYKTEIKIDESSIDGDHIFF